MPFVARNLIFGRSLSKINLSKYIFSVVLDISAFQSKVKTELLVVTLISANKTQNFAPEFLK